MPIGIDTHATRGDLPHLSRQGKTYFVTFCTRDRLVLPNAARDAVLKTCNDAHERNYWLHCAVVMPDHVHLLITPYDHIALEQILMRIKGRSARQANIQLRRAGPLWQRESFDHILRSDESMRLKAEYICNNPVRAGIIADWRDYPWTFVADTAG